MKRFILLFLVSFMLINVFSCSKSTENPENGENITTVETAETTTADKSFKADYLPDVKYDGYEFRMGVISPDNTLNAGDYESESGETVNDAIYKRNRLIEERYDIKFKTVDITGGPNGYENSITFFRKSVAANTDDFDISMLISRDAFSAALEGSLLPVKQLKYADITQPWYAKNINDQISINNKLYFAYTAECLSMYAYSLGVYFNKQMASDLGAGDIYSMVRDGKWTIDKFFELSKGVAKDMNGDDLMDDADRYGILSECDMFYPCFWISSDVKTVKKNDEGLLIFDGKNEKLLDILGKIYDNICTGDKIYFDPFIDKLTTYTSKGGEDWRRITRLMFENNQGLLFVSTMSSAKDLRTMDTDFGIVPFPKYNEAQDGYLTRVIDGWIKAVPTTAKDPERTSVILEALAVESKNIVLPAYYDIALKMKESRDEESAEMLDIIFNNLTIDIGDTFYMDPVRNIYVFDILIPQKNDFVSAIEKKTGLVEKALNKANETVLAMQ